MVYTLMHKSIPVIDVSIDTENGRITGLGAVHQSEHLPIGVFFNNDKDIYRFESWWKSRSIPMSRAGLDRALREMGLPSSDILPLKSLGLSLSDQYWIKPVNSDIQWENVNFFDNDFSEEMGEILFGEKHSSQNPDMLSPDNVSNGWLCKKWKIRDGKRYLVKGGSGFMQEPFNEVIASNIADKLGFPHTDYILGYTSKKMPVSVCECFINRDTELIGAAFINTVLPLSENESKYEHFVRCCEYLNIPNYTKRLDEMMILDFIIANQDRHMGNFGIIRNANTLEFIGFAPIFDNGTSIRYDTPVSEIDLSLDISSQPFESFHNEQIKLVKDKQLYVPDKLCGIGNEIDSLFSDKRTSEYINPSRAEMIRKIISARINMLNKHLHKKMTVTPVYKPVHKRSR